MKLLKTSFCVLLAILLMAAYIPVNSHAADTASLKSGVGFISADSLRLRASPSTQSATLAYASKGEVVVLCERIGIWYRVIYNLQEDTFDFDVDANLSDGLVSWILQFGSGVTAIAPEKLVNMIKGRLNDLNDIYK